MSHSVYYPVYPLKTLNTSRAADTAEALNAQEIILTGVAFGLLALLVLFYLLFCCHVWGTHAGLWAFCPCSYCQRRGAGAAEAEATATADAGAALRARGPLWLSTVGAITPPPSYSNIYGNVAGVASLDAGDKCEIDGAARSVIAVWRVIVECSSKETARLNETDPPVFETPPPCLPNTRLAHSVPRTNPHYNTTPNSRPPPRQFPPRCQTPRTNPKAKFSEPASEHNHRARRNIFQNSRAASSTAMRATENLQSPSSNNFNSLINSNRRSESCLNADNSKREIKRSDDEEGRWDDAKGQQSSMKNRSPYLILADRSGKCIAGLEKTPPAALLPPINFPEERTSQTLEPLNLVSMLHGACAPISDIPETALALETKNDTGYSTSSASTICQLTNETLGLSGLCSSISTNPASPYPFDDRTLLLETSDTQTDERNKRSVEHSLAEDSYVSTSSTQHPRRERSSLSGSYLEMMRLVDDRIQKQSESSSVKSRQSMREHEHLRLHKMSNFRTPSKNSTTNPPMNVQSSACNTPPPVYHAVWIRIHLPSGSLSDYIPAKKSALKEGMYVVEILPHSVYPIQACSVEVSSDTEEVDVVRIECLTADRTTVESFQYGMLES